MKKDKFKRFLKRNCIKIPFYAAAILGLGLVSNLERPQEPQTDFNIPVGVYEVFATEQPEMGVQEPKTAQEMIVDACAEYGISHEIPMAIAKLETGHFTSRAFLEGNNVGGMSIDEVPLSFDTLEEGVDAFVGTLARWYFAKGLDTPEEIGQKYCPSSETWAEVVKELMKG